MSTASSSSKRSIATRFMVPSTKSKPRLDYLNMTQNISDTNSLVRTQTTRLNKSIEYQQPSKVPNDNSIMNSSFSSSALRRIIKPLPATRVSRDKILNNHQERYSYSIDSDADSGSLDLSLCENDYNHRMQKHIRKEKGVPLADITNKIFNSIQRKTLEPPFKKQQAKAIVVNPLKNRETKNVDVINSSFDVLFSQEDVILPPKAKVYSHSRKSSKQNNVVSATLRQNSQPKKSQEAPATLSQILSVYNKRKPQSIKTLQKPPLQSLLLRPSVQSCNSAKQLQKEERESVNTQCPDMSKISNSQYDIHDISTIRGDHNLGVDHGESYIYEKNLDSYESTQSIVEFSSQSLNKTCSLSSRSIDESFDSKAKNMNAINYHKIIKGSTPSVFRKSDTTTAFKSSKIMRSDEQEIENNTIKMLTIAAQKLYTITQSNEKELKDLKNQNQAESRKILELNKRLDSLANAQAVQIIYYTIQKLIIIFEDEAKKVHS